MPIHRDTAYKIIAMEGKSYPTYKGRIYKAFKAYQGDYHSGWIIKKIVPDRFNGRPQFETYVDKIPKIKTVLVNKTVAANIISLENHIYTTEMNKYKAIPTYDGKGNHWGWAIYRYNDYDHPNENNKTYLLFIPSQPKDPLTRKEMANPGY